MTSRLLDELIERKKSSEKKQFQQKKKQQVELQKPMTSIQRPQLKLNNPLIRLNQKLAARREASSTSAESSRIATVNARRGIQTKHFQEKQQHIKERTVSDSKPPPAALKPKDLVISFVNQPKDEPNQPIVKPKPNDVAAESKPAPKKTFPRAADLRHAPNSRRDFPLNSSSTYHESRAPAPYYSNHETVLYPPHSAAPYHAHHYDQQPATPKPPRSQSSSLSERFMSVEHSYTDVYPAPGYSHGPVPTYGGVYQQGQANPYDTHRVIQPWDEDDQPAIVRR